MAKKREKRKKGKRKGMKMQRKAEKLGTWRHEFQKEQRSGELCWEANSQSQHVWKQIESQTDKE